MRAFGRLVTVVTCLLASTAVQSESPQDLGSVLAGQKDLSIYYSLIQARQIDDKASVEVERLTTSSEVSQYPPAATKLRRDHGEHHPRPTCTVADTSPRS
jgi:hypothetical protein